MRGTCASCKHPSIYHTQGKACVFYLGGQLYCACTEFECDCDYCREERAEQVNTKEKELEIDQLQRERALLYHQMDVLQARARELTHEIEELYANGK